jgi:Na+/proline symporter
VLRYMPAGLVGLLVAVVLCAAMSSISSELAALGSTSAIDLYKRFSPAREEGEATRKHELRVSKLLTVGWGLLALALALASYASLLDNLIQAVNILGSIFYGTVLGLFVVGFFCKRVSAMPGLVAALVAQATVIGLFLWSDLGFLWYNVIGCGIVVVVSLALQPVIGGRASAKVAS